MCDVGIHCSLSVLPFDRSTDRYYSQASTVPGVRIKLTRIFGTILLLRQHLDMTDIVIPSSRMNLFS